MEEGIGRSRGERIQVHFFLYPQSIEVAQDF